MDQSSIPNRQDLPTAGLVRSGVLSINEIDQLREFVRGADIEVVQLEAGTMRGAIANANLGRSSIHSNQLSLAARGRGKASDHHLTFVIFGDQSRGKFNNHIFRPDLMVLYRAGAEFVGTTEGPFQDWVFTVDERELFNAVEALMGGPLVLPPGSVVGLSIHPLTASDLRRFAGHVCTLFANDRGNTLSPKIVDTLHRHVIELLAEAIIFAAPQSQEPQKRAHESHQRIVRRVEDFVSSRLYDPVTVSDLCAAARVSERTLRNAFMNVVGVSPTTFLKVRRLHRARIQLTQASTKRITIGEVAMENGFFHLSYFARDYAQFFGEKPSTTLKRANGVWGSAA